MCPIPIDVIEKSCKQVEALFDHFLKIEDFLVERNEVHHESFTRGGLQDDSAKRLSSGNELQLISRGTDADIADIVRKRRSSDLEGRYVPTQPPPPAAPTAPSGACRLQRDSAQVMDNEIMEVQTLQRGHSSEFVRSHIKSEGGRESPQSQGPTEKQMHDAALLIAEVGDQIERQYGGRMHEMKAKLSQFIRTADKTLCYNTFAVHVNELVGDNRDWTHFMFMLHLSKRVLIETNTVGKTMSHFFRRYLGAAFAEQIAQQNDVVQFVSGGASSAV